MTHEQLLQRVRNEFFFTQGIGTITHLNSCSTSPCHCSAMDQTHFKLRNTMLAVVELHRPEAQEHGQYEKCWNCNLLYPCLTIQTIEKGVDDGIC